MKTCVVIASREDTRNIMAASLKARGLDAALLASLGELRGALETIPASGILLELATAVTASTQFKENTRELFELFPFAKFRLAGSEALIVGDTLDSFASKCCEYRPRRIRASLRESRFLAVYLSADESFVDAEKVVTSDVSDRGCFVYSAREWTPGSRVWLKFPGVEAVFCGHVCSVRPWGNNTFLPGIGVGLETSIAEVRELAGQQPGSRRVSNFLVSA
jgi:hypothetical protein